MLVSCGEKPAVQNSGTLTVTDDLGREIHLKAHPKKVMALAPSMTEYLALICPKEQLVARTQNCDYPKWVEGLQEVVNYPSLNLELLLQLKPDLILTQKGITPESDLNKLNEFGIPVYVFKNDSLDKIINCAERIGSITGNYNRGKEVSDSLTIVRNELAKGEDEDSVSVIGIMSNQTMVAYGKGSLVDQMMNEAGLVNGIDSSFISAYPQINEEYLLRRNPDVLFVTTVISWEEFFVTHPNLKELDAFKSDKLYQIEGNLISRQGPRALMGLRDLKKLR